MKPRCWRAPKWSPLWLRRMFPGCWTQEEVDAIKERAEMRYVKFQELFEDDDTRVTPPAAHPYIDNQSAGRDCEFCGREAADPVHDTCPTSPVRRNPS